MNVSSWSAPEFTSLTETINMMRESNWISAMLGGLTHHTKRATNGKDTVTLALTDAKDFTDGSQHWSGLLFTIMSDDKVVIPPSAWSWRLDEQCQLTAILDREGTGRGLHRSTGGPCWVIPGRASTQWPAVED